MSADNVEHSIWLVNNMPEDLVESRTSYEELKELFIDCVHFIENNKLKENE